MKIKMNDIFSNVEEIESKWKELLSSIDGKELSAKIIDTIKGYQNNLQNYSKQIQNGSADNAVKIASTLAVYGQSIWNLQKKESGFTNDEIGIINDIKRLSDDLRNTIEGRFIKFNLNEQLIDAPNSDRKSAQDDILIITQLKQDIEVLKDDHEKHDLRHKKLLSENQSKIDGLEGKIDSFSGIIEKKINEADQFYNEGVASLTQKKEEVDKLLGLISGKSIAGNFEQSAVDEKKMADFLRYASISCMLLIIIIIGYSFYESTTTAFKWENSIFRIVLTFLLSVPSAYLAKESAKHREQHYNHLQTALDLKAINPYIASLPIEEQHKIKADIAEKIFATKDFSNVSKEPYPLNTNDLLMELIKKLDFKQPQTQTNK